MASVVVHAVLSVGDSRGQTSSSSLTGNVRRPHLSTSATSRTLTAPKSAASRAGAVYMLSCRSMTSTATPFSPMNERHACNAGGQGSA